ncbi:MAG: hypothetical protein HC818_04245, partial [Synechococcaceae cyanobacterium RM1_1_27]|nr:hypothetical protein [Synechococcaceae cyanobacterium RM1_1_27]
NPTGYGTSFGTVFFAVGGVFEGRNQEDGVAGLGVGIGLGDPNQAVGVDLSYTITNLEEGFGGANVKLHRNLYQGEAVGVAAAVGLDDFFTTGDLDQDPSIYATTSIIFKTNPDINEFFSRLAFTLGAGNGRFRREEDILSDQDAIGFFGSGALRVTRSVSVITEWDGSGYRRQAFQWLRSGISTFTLPRTAGYCWGWGWGAIFAGSGSLSPVLSIFKHPCFKYRGKARLNDMTDLAILLERLL